MLSKSKKITKLIEIYNRYDKSSDAAAKYKEVTGNDLMIDWSVVDIMKMAQVIINKDDYEIISTNVHVMAPDANSLISTIRIQYERDPYKDESRRRTVDPKQLPTLTQKPF